MQGEKCSMLKYSVPWGQGIAGHESGGRVQLVCYKANQLNGHTVLYKHGEIQIPDTQSFQI